MKPFRITGAKDPEASATDRQERIAWWSQDKIARARIMVVGAGAIGNETLKNLALLGFRYIFVADFDTVSRSNLSRTVLFRRADVGLRKSEVAARRVRELAVADDFCIDWFHGDVVWDLGLGVFQEMDLVLGCLDNVETRRFVNRSCWLAGKPWIDSGIQELGCRVNVYIPPLPPCYECGLSEEQLQASRMRYSCDNFKKAMVAEGKVPTVQVASALVSALQVQEAVKLLCGQQTSARQKVYFQGKTNDFDIFDLTSRPSCDAHALSYPELIGLPLSRENTLAELLAEVCQPDRCGVAAAISLQGQQFSFISTAPCRRCGQAVEFLRPAFRIEVNDLVCRACSDRNGVELAKSPHSANTTSAVTVAEFSLEKTPPEILAMRLSAIGFPFCAVVTVRSDVATYGYFRLDGDRASVMPSIYGLPSHGHSTVDHEINYR